MTDWRTAGEYRLVGWERGNVYYPSFYYLLFYPFSFLSFKWVAVFFYFTQFLWLPFVILWIVKAVSPQGKVSWRDLGLAAILTVNFLPFLETFSEHKVEGIELPLICLAILLFRAGRDFWTGAVLALAMNLKYLPGILLVYFLFKREWRVVRGAAFAQGVILLILIGALGWPVFWKYTLLYPLRALLDPGTAYAWQTALLEWQSLGGTINRWFAMPMPPEDFFSRYLVGGFGPILHGGLVNGITRFLQGGFILLWLFIIRRCWTPAQREEKWTGYLLEISMSLIMIPILINAARVQYGILLLPSFVYVALLLLRTPDRFRRLEKALLVGGYCLSAMVIPGGLLRKLPPHPVWGQEHSLMYLWLGLPFYGYMFLFFCILLCRRRLLADENRSPAPP